MPQATVQISIATQEQRNNVLQVIMAAYIEYAKQSDPSFWPMYEKSIEKTVLSDQTITPIIAEENGKILGAVLYCEPYEKPMGGDTMVINPYPEMRLLAVPPESRDRGIANKLIQFCEQRAVAEGYPIMTLHTTVLMQTAKQMYERRGYKRYENIDFEPVSGFHVWGYQKDLSATAQ